MNDNDLHMGSRSLCFITNESLYIVLLGQVADEASYCNGTPAVYVYALWGVM